eukprot:336675-Prorocentrum_minimum.AAC.1
MGIFPMREPITAQPWVYTCAAAASSRLHLASASPASTAAAASSACNLDSTAASSSACRRGSGGSDTRTLRGGPGGQTLGYSLLITRLLQLHGCLLHVADIAIK